LFTASNASNLGYSGMKISRVSLYFQTPLIHHLKHPPFRKSLPSVKSVRRSLFR
jgi:hypothetical protein